MNFLLESALLVRLFCTATASSGMPVLKLPGPSPDLFVNCYFVVIARESLTIVVQTINQPINPEMVRSTSSPLIDSRDEHRKFITVKIAKMIKLPFVCYVEVHDECHKATNYLTQVNLLLYFAYRLGSSLVRVCFLSV